MTVNLVIESAPTPQARMSFSLTGGSLVIGRGDDADWQLDDPDMYLSRRHCIITLADQTLSATDSSRDGTYIDGSETALGTGKTMVLEDGMRLRLGDFVLRVDMADAKSAPKAPPKSNNASPFNFGHTDMTPAPAPTERPVTLPNPFDPYATSSPARDPEKQQPAPKPFGMDDPFALDPSNRDIADDTPKTTGGYFGTQSRAPIPQDEPPQATKAPDTSSAAAPAPTPAPAVAKPPAPTQPAPSAPAAASDSDVLAALLKGMGVDAKSIEGANATDQAEAIGAQYRMLVDGVMQMLRARASAKQQVRAAQTLISSANVNPLKFLATTDDAITTLLSGDRPGYLPANDAIVGAYRDLADHQMRTWKALQSALRRMIDQFDPEAIETEIAETGTMSALLSGGRNALLWQAYEEKYRDIARAAEERFLGEVGADFRDAYEGHQKEERS